MSSVCLGCDTGITSSDYNATNICSSCQLDDIREQVSIAEKIITSVLNCDTVESKRLAIEYKTKYELEMAL
jgi:hypothetical protein